MSTVDITPVEQAGRALAGPAVASIVDTAAALLDAPIGPDTDLFAVGGNSITMVVLVGRLQPVLGPALTPALMLRGRTPRRIAELVAGTGRAAGTGTRPTDPVARRSPRWVGGLPVTQYRMWYQEHQFPGTGDSANPVLFRIHGRLDLDALDRSVRYLVRRHEALRTRLRSADGRHVDVDVLDGESFDGDADGDGAGAGLLLAVEDVDDDAFSASLEGFLWQGFDLSAGLPLRARVFRLGGEEHVLAFSVHHTAYDGWSDGVLARDLSHAYAAYVAGRQPEQPPVYGFHTAARSQQDGVEAAGGGDDDFWLEHLRGVPDLPLGSPPAAPTGPVDEVPVPLRAVDQQRLRRTCARSGTTTTAVYLAAWILALREETGSADFAIGMPVAGRLAAAAEQVIGCFASSAILRFPASVGAGRDCVRHAADLLERVMVDQFMPLERLYWELRPQDTGRHPFCQVGFVVQNNQHDALVLAGLAVERIRVPQRTSAYEMALVLWEGAELGSHLWYRTDVVPRELAQRLVERWLRHMALLCAEAGEEGT